MEAVPGFFLAALDAFHNGLIYSLGDFVYKLRWLGAYFGEEEKEKSRKTALGGFCMCSIAEIHDSCVQLGIEYHLPCGIGGTWLTERIS